MSSWFKRKKSLTDLLKEKNKSDLEEKSLPKDSPSFLKKSTDFFRVTLLDLFRSKPQVDEGLRETIEESLIGLDFGVHLSTELSTKIITRLAKSSGDHREVMRDELKKFYFFNETDQRINFQPGRTNFFLMVGANGSGKTTTIAKLTHLYKEKGYKVLIIAADTFRAGATEQLKFWAEKLEVSICVSDRPKEDPSALIYRSLSENRDKNYDLIICDTAGRQHNNVNLLQELNKVHRVVGKFQESWPHETLLVLDSTIGQGSFLQAKSFLESSKVTGIVLTKMDGMTKGGIVFSIKNRFNIPVKLIGTGERQEDLEEFDLESVLKCWIPT